MLEIDEKPKRKQMPRRYRWWHFAALIMVVILILVGSLLGCLAIGVCPQGATDCFYWINTEIAATNHAVETLLYQTQIASTPSP